MDERKTMQSLKDKKTKGKNTDMYYTTQKTKV
jgi:hypothetical protein